MSKIDDAVHTFLCAIEREGFDAVEHNVSSLPDEMDGELEPWQAALIEGLADAVRYAQSVRRGRSRLRVQFKPGSSATWEWVRGERISGEFRQVIEESVARLLDGEAPDAR